MPADVFWHNEHHSIIQVAFVGTWTVEDFVSALSETRQDGR